MFIKLGKLDEAHKAIEEAEKVNCAGNPYVWCVLGQLLLSQGDIEQAQASFSKGLTIHPNDVRCHLWLAKTHVMQESFEMAEGILNTLTKTNGWDCAEAW
jgi:predicted Zn-dependent protease